MRKILKGIFTAVISFALTVLTVVAGVVPATIFVKAEDTTVAYEQTNVMDDLKGSVVGGKQFTLSDYGFIASRETQVVAFVEYCYSFYQNLQDYYGLYVYVYNPQGRHFVVDHPLNKIQMSCGQDTVYTKYPLKFLNASTQIGYEGLFYKFKVSLNAVQKQELVSEFKDGERVYRISGIELLEQGKTSSDEYMVGTE